MSNSSLVSYTRISPNRTIPRNHAIDRITVHCTAGQSTAVGLGNIFAPVSRRASCNYGIGKDGAIALICPEKDRSWCSSSPANDHRAVTIEVSSDAVHPYKVNDAAYKALLNLLTDICKRNGKNRLVWFGDKTKTLSYAPKANEMVMTVHRWFANKACPGDYLYNLHPQIAAEVNRRLAGGTASTVVHTASKPKTASGKTVRVTTARLNIRRGPGTNYPVCGKITDRGIYTVIQESPGPGASKWGKLKSGAGWISLDYVTRI